MPAENELAQYACDRCKHRKLRCSREYPKCNNCKEWTGGCVYSRHGRLRRRPRSNVLRRPRAPLRHDGQSSLHSPTTPMTSTSPIFPPFPEISTPFKQPQVSPPSDDGAPLHIKDTGFEDTRAEGVSERVLKDDYGRPFYVGPSPMASLLSQANSNIELLKNETQDSNFQVNAEKSLSELSNTFAALNFEDPSNVRMNVRRFRQNTEVFFIPRKEEGFRMIEIFLNIIQKGTPFFTVPPLELLPKLVFEPPTVQDRGWLLLFNIILSTAISLTIPLDVRLNQGLQWNTWMLIEDSGILLEPSEISIQALLLVASHGQEISTPSLCWTLISHACQMAQTLALHLPNPNAPRNSEVYLQRNCLFWSLFVIDKSLSLSFGRPPLLPNYLYNNVPPPDPDLLARYRPHQSLARTDETVFENLPHRGFGAFYIMRVIELAHLQGIIHDSLHRKGRSSENIDKLKESLDLWLETTQRLASAYEDYYGRDSVDEEEKKAVQMGIDNLTFQYHHLIVYLTKGERTNQSTCLKAARSAIPLLSKLVASSAQVFNGVVWQLLYQPFTPYFVIFAKIISEPQSNDRFTDLQLLRQVVLYFLQMHNNHQSARKLERVAETFTRLAEAYVRRSMLATHRTSSSTIEVHEHKIKPTSYGPIMTESNPTTSSDFVDNSAQALSRFSSVLPADDNQPLFNSETFDSDPMNLLNFFSISSSDSSAGESLMTSEPSNPIDHSDPQLLQWSDDPVFRGLENIAQNQRLDASFDWFAWDQYYSSIL